MLLEKIAGTSGAMFTPTVPGGSAITRCSAALCSAVGSHIAKGMPPSITPSAAWISASAPVGALPRTAANTKLVTLRLAAERDPLTLLVVQVGHVRGGGLGVFDQERGPQLDLHFLRSLGPGLQLSPLGIRHGVGSEPCVDLLVQG